MSDSQALRETLASYVPGLFIKRLASQGTPGEPVAEQFPAAVLLADISGFTALAEDLAQRGPAGAEELTGLLNDYFGRLIHIVDQHGGEVVKFADDALLALWPALPDADIEVEAVAILAQRAVQCSQEIFWQLNDYLVLDKYRLTLRMSIGAGSIQIARVGGRNNRWVLMLSGVPLKQVSRAQGYAAPGQIVLAAEVWQMVADSCRGLTLHDGSGRLESLQETIPPRASPALTNLPGELAQPFIPSAIRTRLEAGQSAWLAELRPLSVMFVNLPELDQDTPLENVQNIISSLQDILNRFEGSLNKLSFDDKGLTFVAAFGLPPLAHEDDPERSVRAALSMTSLLQDMNVRTTIGIATGRVYCGSVGTPQRREYTMMGAVVNLAARLMQAADDILVDTTTQYNARGVTFYELPPIDLKGKSKPVTTYRPKRDRRKRRQSQTSGLPEMLVGREAERKLLAEQLPYVLDSGECRIVLIEGEAGIGKTLLVNTMQAQAAELGLESMSDSGDAIEKSRPYHAWRGILASLLASEGNNDSEARGQTLLRKFEGEPALFRLAPLLNDVLPLDIAENDITRQMTGQVRAENTQRLIAQLLQQATRDVPHLLVIEDIHMLDSASWAVVLTVSQQVRSLLFILTSRPFPDQEPSELEQIRRATNSTVLQLEAMPAHDILTVVARRLGCLDVPDPVARLLHDKAQGNPFFSEELAYALRDKGYITISQGKCSLATHASTLHAVSFPDTIQGVITSRIDSLQPAQQLALKVASVIGRGFPLRTLRDVHPIEHDRPFLRQYVEFLTELQITQLETSDPYLTYLFKHIITQEVAYNLMPFAQRRQLHRSIAEWYERAHADELDSHYSLLAHHWSQAVGETVAAPKFIPQAMDYLDKAGEGALQAGAYREAARLFRQALKMIEHPSVRDKKPRQAKWERQLGEAYLGLGDLAQSRNHLRHALELQGQPEPRTFAGIISELVWQALLQIARRIRSTRADTAAESVRTELMQTAQTFERLGEIYYFSNETARLAGSFLRTANLSERASPSSPELARAYASMAIMSAAAPWDSIAEAYAQRAREMANRLGHLPSQAYVSMVIGAFHVGEGHWEAAQSVLGEALSFTTELGDHRRWAEARLNEEMIAYFHGNFRHCQELFHEIQETGLERDDKQVTAWGLNGQAMALIPRGQTAIAIELLDNALPILIEISDRVAQSFNFGVRALAHLYRDEPQHARTSASELLSLIPGLPTSYGMFNAYANLPAVHLQLWETIGQYRAPAKHAARNLYLYAWMFRVGQPRAWLWRGLYNWLAGRQNKARQAWQRSITIAESLSMPYDQGLAHFEMGRHMRADTYEREKHLQHAEAIFTDLDASLDLARTQHALDK